MLDVEDSNYEWIEKVEKSDNLAALLIRVREYPRGDALDALTAALRAKFGDDTLILFLKEGEDVTQLSYEDMALNGWSRTNVLDA